MAPVKHARLNCSSAKRWINCPGSVKLAELFPQGSSIYADEGSLAHELAEKWLIGTGGNAEIRSKIEMFYIDHPDLGGSYKEMQDYLEPYIEFIAEELDAARHEDPGATIHTETRVDLSQWIPDGFGTTDVAILGGDTLHVIDLKYGKGVPVSAEGNPQIRLYALGMLDLLGDIYDIEKVKMTIYQPRLDSVSTDIVTAEELRTWGDLIIKPAAKLALEDNAPLCAGDWCQFCPARNQCRERADHYLQVKEYKEKALLSNKETADILQFVDGLVRWAEGLKEDALARMLEGEEFPGWKVVEGRSNRKYSVDDLTIAKACTAAGYADAMIWEKKLLSLSNMEKLMGKKDFEKVLGGYVETPQGKPTLAPESDKRPSLIATAADDFADE